MNKNILITGATGFLGSYILKTLLDKKDITPVVLVRGKKDRTAAKRMEDVLKYFYGSDYKKYLKRIKIIEGEIDSASLGIAPGIKRSMISEIDEIYHSAAIAEFRIPLDIIRKSNVDGAENVFNFAMECKKNGRLTKVNHISTTFVAGTKAGVFHEDQLDVGQKFNNTYEQTKFEAELLAHKFMDRGLPITIFRPSILTGDYESGRTSNFKMLYQPLRFFAKELFEAIPGDRATQFNMIPVDFVSDAIYAIAEREDVVGGTFSIANTQMVMAGHFIDVASDFFGFKKPEFVPLKDYDMDSLTAVQKSLIGPYIPYFNYKTAFNSARAQNLLKNNDLSAPVVDDGFLIRLFEFCDKVGFIKRGKKYAIAG